MRQSDSLQSKAIITPGLCYVTYGQGRIEGQLGNQSATCNAVLFEGDGSILDIVENYDCGSHSYTFAQNVTGLRSALTLGPMGELNFTAPGNASNYHCRGHFGNQTFYTYAATLAEVAGEPYAGCNTTFACA